MVSCRPLAVRTAPLLKHHTAQWKRHCASGAVEHTTQERRVTPNMIRQNLHIEHFTMIAGRLIHSLHRQVGYYLINSLHHYARARAMGWTYAHGGTLGSKDFESARKSYSRKARPTRSTALRREYSPHHYSCTHTRACLRARVRWGGHKHTGAHREAKISKDLESARKSYSRKARPTPGVHFSAEDFSPQHYAHGRMLARARAMGRTCAHGGTQRSKDLASARKSYSEGTPPIPEVPRGSSVSLGTTSPWDCSML